MVLRTARSAFILAGLVLLLSALTDARSAIRANMLSGQGSLVIRETTEQQWHASAAQETQRTTAGQITLGSLFILLGLGLHASFIRRQAAGRPVKVHQAPESRRRSAVRRNWILWMNVRI